MRQINEIIVHCTATPEGRHHTAADIDRWHRLRHFNGIGYHYVILLDGTIQTGRRPEIAGAHCKGHNSHSLGVVYVGGLDAKGNPKDTRTPQQKNALTQLLKQLKRQFPKASIHSHRDFAVKACPCFDATTEYRNL